LIQRASSNLKQIRRVVYFKIFFPLNLIGATATSSLDCREKDGIWTTQNSVRKSSENRNRTTRIHWPAYLAKLINYWDNVYYDNSDIKTNWVQLHFLLGK
jgi:hypothetical protein